MKLDGRRTLEATIEQSYALLTNPEVLVRTMPGLKSLVARGPWSYDAEIEWGVASIGGKYVGEIRMVDAKPPAFYRMMMEGQGPKGLVTIDLAMTLTSSGQRSTELHYQGEAHVDQSATGSAVGQRIMSGLTQAMMNQFFSALAKEAKRI